MGLVIKGQRVRLRSDKRKPKSLARYLMSERKVLISPEPNLSANSTKLFLREPLVFIISEPFYLKKWGSDISYIYSISQIDDFSMKNI